MVFLRSPHSNDNDDASTFSDTTMDVLMSTCNPCSARNRPTGGGRAITPTRMNSFALSTNSDGSVLSDLDEHVSCGEFFSLVREKEPAPTVMPYELFLDRVELGEMSCGEAPTAWIDKLKTDFIIASQWDPDAKLVLLKNRRSRKRHPGVSRHRNAREAGTEASNSRSEARARRGTKSGDSRSAATGSRSAATGKKGNSNPKPRKVSVTWQSRRTTVGNAELDESIEVAPLRTSPVVTEGRKLVQ